MDFSSMNLRIGQGIDIHPFLPGRELILGGVKIAHDRGLAGHSDADALLHALMDALLGAAGKGDIGTYFPNDDPRWKGAASTRLLEQVWGELAGEGWRVGNLDCSLLCEAPKLQPHIPAMKACISEILQIETTQCGIKATTAEKLGFVGRQEGLMTFAVVLIWRNGLG